MSPSARSLGVFVRCTMISAVLLVGARAGAVVDPPPPSPPAPAQVRGSLDKEIIRRIIRTHINEVRLCYERELASNANLTGRVHVQFTVGKEGSVVSSIVESSTLESPTVEQCIASAVKTWMFPKPQGGGIVVVTYPFVFKTADADTPPSASAQGRGQPSPPTPSTSGPSLVPAFIIADEKLSGEQPHPDPNLLKNYSGRMPYMVYRVCIHSSGKISSVSVEQGRSELDPQIIETLKTWRFKPQPKEVCFDKVVEF